MLWVGPVYSNLILTSPVNPLRNLSQLDERLNIERLDRYEVSPTSEAHGSDTVVFLENIVGFTELDDNQNQKMRALIASGALVAFTCQSNSLEKKNDVLTELFDQKIECSHFNPREIYGETISEQCRLHLKYKKKGMNDIFYFTNKVEGQRQSILRCA